HTVLVRSFANAFGLPPATSEPIVARCQSVAARAKDAEARMARTAATSSIPGRKYGLRFPISRRPASSSGAVTTIPRGSVGDERSTYDDDHHYETTGARGRRVVRHLLLPFSGASLS